LTAACFNSYTVGKQETNKGYTVLEQSSPYTKVIIGYYREVHFKQPGDIPGCFDEGAGRRAHTRDDFVCGGGSQTRKLLERSEQLNSHI
jgi:hypothetical protein